MLFVVLFLAILYTELMGHIVHKFLHKEYIPWLSDQHVKEHHLIYYPPGSKMRTLRYEKPEAHSIMDKVGLEWIVPIALMTIPLLLVAIMMGISISVQN